MNASPSISCQCNNNGINYILSTRHTAMNKTDGLVRRQWEEYQHLLSSLLGPLPALRPLWPGSICSELRRFAPVWDGRAIIQQMLRESLHRTRHCASLWAWGVNQTEGPGPSMDLGRQMDRSICKEPGRCQLPPLSRQRSVCGL